jgi:hypothetical protein
MQAVTLTDIAFLKRHQQSCQTVQLSVFQYVVKLTFDSFLTEDGFDIVRIYDGTSTEHELIAELAGPHQH